MKIKVVFLLALLVSTNLFSQNLKYTHKVLRDLCAKEMYGRATYKNGDSIAADYIAKEFEKCKLKPINNEKGTTGYKQFFNVNNIVLEEVSFALNDEIMKPDDDYYILGNSPVTNFELKNIRPLMIDDKKHWELVKGTTLNDMILVFNVKTFPISVKEIVNFIDTGLGNIQPKLVIFQGYERISYYIGRENIARCPVLQIVGDKIGTNVASLKLHIKSKLETEHKTQNIIGIIEGKQKDKYILITSHYDALGMFGDKVFTGAHDNACAVATVIDFANYYTKVENKPQYSLVLIAFGAEEIGMLGSKYYVNNAIVPNENIKLVINLDLVGSGSGGLGIVNGDADNTTKYVKEIQKINTSEYYFHKINIGPNSCNSDHCAFVEKNIPAIFIMTAGDECKWSHSIYDNYENLPLTKYESLFRLIRDFIATTK